MELNRKRFYEALGIARELNRGRNRTSAIDYYGHLEAINYELEKSIVKRDDRNAGVILGNLLEILARSEVSDADAEEILILLRIKLVDYGKFEDESDKPF